MVSAYFVYIVFLVIVIGFLHYNHYDFFAGDFKNNSILPDNFNTSFKDISLNMTFNNTNIVNGEYMNNVNSLLLDREGKNTIDPLMFRDKINGIKDLYINKSLTYYNDTGAKNVFAPQIIYEGSDIPVKYEFSVNKI